MPVAPCESQCPPLATQQVLHLVAGDHFDLDFSASCASFVERWQHECSDDLVCGDAHRAARRLPAAGTARVSASALACMPRACSVITRASAVGSSPRPVRSNRLTPRAAFPGLQWRPRLAAKASAPETRAAGPCSITARKLRQRPVKRRRVGSVAWSGSQLLMHVIR